jgi:hypothetical protein
MPTNRELRTALLKHLGVSQQRLSQRAKNTKQKYGPMSTEEATYVIAHQEGLDLTKYLDPSAVDRVRNLIPNTGHQRIIARNTEKSSQSRRAHVRIKIESALPDVDVFLSSTIARDAKKMANLYPVYYVLENSLRIVIKRIMEKKHGTDWWDIRVKKEVKEKVTDRKNKEHKQPWHGKRGQHEIFYSDFGDLRAIIEKNWDDFKDLFPTRSWITQKLDELENPRNILAHHNPVNNIDKNRIDLYFHDWVTLLSSRKDMIP